MRVVHARSRLIDDFVAGAQRIVRPVLVLTHHYIVPKWDALPYIAADGRADIAEKDVLDPHRAAMGKATTGRFGAVGLAEEETDKWIGVGARNLARIRASND